MTRSRNTNTPSVLHKPIKLRLWGDFALFTDPIHQVDRVSYPLPTAAALRGILRWIFWEPEFQWEIRKIQVLREIQYLNLMRNEIKHKASPRRRIFVEDVRTQRLSRILTDVEYVIEADVRPYGKKAPEKYRDQAINRIKNGTCTMQPWFGCREFTAYFSSADGSEQPILLDRDLGRMFFDFTYHADGTREPHFWSAKLEQGELVIPEMLYDKFRRPQPYLRLDKQTGLLVPGELHEDKRNYSGRLDVL